MFDLSEAENTARKEVEKIVDADSQLSKSEVDEVRLESENEWIWTFAADIPKLINEGWAPGAITILIDKTDGHVWTEEEESVFYKKWERTRRKIGFLK